jgi:hypothetical protein
MQWVSLTTLYQGSSLRVLFQGSSARNLFQWSLRNTSVSSLRIYVRRPDSRGLCKGPLLESLSGILTYDHSLPILCQGYEYLSEFSLIVESQESSLMNLFHGFSVRNLCKAPLFRNLCQGHESPSEFSLTVESQESSLSYRFPQLGISLKGLYLGISIRVMNLVYQRTNSGISIMGP